MAKEPERRNEREAEALESGKSFAMRDDQYSDEEAACRYQATLRKVIATPPDHRAKPKPGASPKKRGRPRKDLIISQMDC